MYLAQPGWLWLMALMPLPWLLERARARIAWPDLAGFGRRRRIGWTWLQAVPALLRGLAIGCVAVALARPQSAGGTITIAGKGVAIVVALDQSSSMNTRDFPTDRGTRMLSRLEAAKKTLINFVRGRSDDLIGLVVFADYPQLRCPPVLDHDALIEKVEAVNPALVGDNGTNIGDAIAIGLEALLIAPPKKKVLVLLTDGHNEPGVPHPLDPEAAAILARDLGVTLHTIAIGHVGGPPPGIDPDRERSAATRAEGPNLPLLERLAQLSGGQSFLATDAEILEHVFQRIDALEKSPVRGQKLTRYHEHYARWAIAALALLLLDRLLALGRLRRLP
jgi:Ca-activated chloride channel family protein